MTVTLLTSRRFHPEVLAMVAAFREAGIDLVPSPALLPGSTAVLQWGFERPGARRQIRKACLSRGIPFLNPRVLSERSVRKRLEDGGLAVSAWAAVEDVSEAEAGANEIGYPVELTTAYGGRVRRVQDVTELRAGWTPRHAVVREPAATPRPLTVVGEAVFGQASGLEVALAKSACALLAIDFAIVVLAARSSAPVVVSVQHRRPELGAVDGAFSALIRLVRGRGVEARPEPDHTASGGAGASPPRVSIVTGLPSHPAAEAVRAACSERGLDAKISTTLQPDSQAAVLWGLDWRHQRAAWRHARAIGIPVAGGEWLSMSSQLGALRRARVLVPAFRTASTVELAERRAHVLGYPVLVGADADPELHRARLVYQERELAPACESLGGPLVIQELRWRSRRLLRIWVASGEVVLARSRALHDLRSGHTSTGAWRECDVAPAVERAAVAACAALRLPACMVEGVEEPDGLTVLRIFQRRLGVGALPSDAARRIHVALAAAALRSLREVAEPARPPRPLRVVMARPYTNRRRARIWGICAAYQELLRRGHDVTHLNGAYDAAQVARADLVLQDPRYGIGMRRRSDRLNRRLVAEATAPCHLLRHPYGRRRGKLGALSLARRLGIPHPRTIRARRVRADHLPVVVKPTHGSLGRGVFRIDDIDQLRRMPKRTLLAQQYIDSGTGYSVSARVVTVRDRVVAAGIFFHRGSLVSNVSRGGRVIALTGPGASARLREEEAWLLGRIGIDPMARRVPGHLARMARTVGAYLARRGVQMVGQDYVVDGRGRWYFLEANRAFGIALFNVTDGDGYPSTRRGYRLAGAVLADGFESALVSGPPEPSTGVMSTGSAAASH